MYSERGRYVFGEQAKRARHSQVCSIENCGYIYYWASEASPTLGCSIEISRDIYIAYYTSKSGICLVISRVASYFHEPKASANTAYE